jgi:hypothetical protein
MSPFERDVREERFLASKNAADANNTIIVNTRGNIVLNR